MYFPPVFYFCQFCPSIDSLYGLRQGALGRTFFQINVGSFDLVKIHLYTDSFLVTVAVTKYFQVVMLTWSIYSKNRAGLSTSRSTSSAFQENRGSDKVMKISPRITGNLIERNQIHETYPSPLLGHTKNTEH